MEPIQQKIKDQITAVLRGVQWTLTNTTHKAEYDQKLDVGKYELKFGTTTVASFQLYPMINCCGICVSTQAEVAPEYRGRGLGTLLNSLRIDIARYLGYGLLLCTDVDSNEYQRRILKKNGWKDIHTFLNPRTKNKIHISVIGL